MSSNINILYSNYKETPKARRPSFNKSKYTNELREQIDTKKMNQLYQKVDEQEDFKKALMKNNEVLEMQRAEEIERERLKREQFRKENDNLMKSKHRQKLEEQRKQLEEQRQLVDRENEDVVIKQELKKLREQDKKNEFAVDLAYQIQEKNRKKIIEQERERALEEQRDPLQGCVHGIKYGKCSICNRKLPYSELKKKKI